MYLVLETINDVCVSVYVSLCHLRLFKMKSSSLMLIFNRNPTNSISLMELVLFNVCVSLNALLHSFLIKMEWYVSSIK